MTPIGETIKKIDTFLANSPDILKGALDSRRFTRKNKQSQMSFQVNHPSDLLLSLLETHSDKRKIANANEELP